MTAPWDPCKQDREWLSEREWLELHEGVIANRESMEDVKVLFLGDSITEGWSGEGAGEWEKRFSPLKTLNAGIRGDETRQVLWRIAHGLPERMTPKVCILLIGTNNIGNTGDNARDTVTGIEAVVTELQSCISGMLILLHTIFPRDAKPDTPLRATVTEANRLLRQKFADHHNIKLLDYTDLFTDSDGNLLEELMPDLLHLSPEGYELWASKLLPEIEAVLKSAPDTNTYNRI